jgi:hypothetical protein
MATLVERKVIEHAGASLDELIGAIVLAMIEAHAIDPALHDHLLSHVPHADEDDADFDARLRNAFQLAIDSHAHELVTPLPRDRILFVLTQMVEALAHGAVLRRPTSMTLTAAKEEAVRAVLAYLHGYARPKVRRSR